MGVKNLWDVLESCKKTLPLHHLQNKRICIDLSCWVVQLQTASKSKSCSKERIYLRALFHRLRALIALNCSLIFVSDGSIPAIKISTYRRRLNLTVEVNQGVASSEKVSLHRNKGSEFSCMIKEAKILGKALGIPCLDGLEEAEAQCALLNSERQCDGCFSSDSDIFLFGARTVYRDICLGDGGYVVCYEMSDIERKLGFGRNSLITLALLLGSDYNNGVHGLGREAACQVVKSIGDKAVLEKVASEGLSFAKKTKKRLKKLAQNLNDDKENTIYNANNMNGSKQCLARDHSYLEVINAYLKPRCHSADSDAVYRALVQPSYEHLKVQQVCGQFFEWPTEKTDEYILPKIAERELRRFNNLRSTSSELGLKLPLGEMPIKCPVSRIIKQRKVQGQECYEVSWDHDLHGLKTSIIPADLIQSACPEKIVEFEEEKAQKKIRRPRKPRAKKSEEEEEESSLADIDLRLRNLLLVIESENDTIISPFVSSSSSSSSTSTMTTQENAKTPLETTTVVVDQVWDTCGEEETQSQSQSQCQKYEDEVIDLLSPSPLGLRYRLVAKRQDSASDRGIVDIVELSDSENDMSPEHTRKARDLRLFLACIKD